MNSVQKDKSDDAALFKKQYSSFIKNDVQIHLPEMIRKNYKVISCICASEKSETYEVLRNKDDKLYILKIISADDDSLSYEDDVLKRLDHPDIPKLIESVRENAKRYIVRQYFPGYPLSHPLSCGRKFKINETLDVAQKLCDILQYLHSRPEPIIYRDIKPQNIVITPEGGVKLVDFDIARLYDISADTDTVYYGTREYSPPEQFGYSQTDARTDIYAVGVLMIHMLTGRPDIGAIADMEDGTLRKILRRCTQFAPKERFHNMPSLKKSLESAVKKQYKKPLRILRNALVLAVCLILGFLAGMYAQRNIAQAEVVAYSGDSTVIFQSALIDEAIRAVLGKTPQEPIYYDELAQVEKLQIWGKDIYNEKQRLILGYEPGFTNVMVYLEDYSGQGHTVRRGDITSLKELALLGNLKELDIVMQQITDISPLAELPLEKLNIAGNQISDLSPLADIMSITMLNIDYNPVDDLSALSSLYYLEGLNASYTLVEDVSPLKELYHLKFLYINDAKIVDVSPLKGHDFVNLFLQNNKIADIEPLSAQNLHVENNPAVQ